MDSRKKMTGWSLKTMVSSGFSSPKHTMDHRGQKEKPPTESENPGSGGPKMWRHQRHQDAIAKMLSGAAVGKGLNASWPHRVAMEHHHFK